MDSSPSPTSTPVPRSADASPHSRPAAPTSVPSDSIPPQPLDQQAPKSPTASFVPPWRRPTLTVSDSGEAFRRPSVQFVPQVKDVSGNPSRSSSAQPPSIRVAKSSDSTSGNSLRRRMSSPPPPAQYRPSVSFDTFSNPAASDFSLTLNRKHKDYAYTKRSRTFLCGTDTNEYSDTALEWLIDELVDDGDEVVCLRVVEKDSKDAYRWQGGQGEKGYHKEAERFLDSIEKKNTDDRAISIVLEFAVGKVHDMIQRMISIYEPAMLVVGTRGRSLTGYSGLLSSGSVSKYCLQYSPVPVIVVRPSSKRAKKKMKRLRDPERTGYRDILDKSEDVPRGRGGHLLDAQNRKSWLGTDMGALGALGSSDADEEARLVAQAIGYQGSKDGRGGHERTPSLSRNTQNGPGPGSRRSSVGSQIGGEDIGSPADPGVLLKSPELRETESPAISDDDVSDLEEEELRPEDEAAMLAYERAQKIVEEERQEAAARAKREAWRSSSGGGRRGRRDDDQEEGAGAAVLGLLGQLGRGMK